MKDKKTRQIDIFKRRRVNTKLCGYFLKGLEALKKGQMTVFMAGEKNLAEEVQGDL